METVENSTKLPEPTQKLWETPYEALQGMRELRKPTTRGIMLCTQALGNLLQLGVNKETLDSWEIIFWTTHNGDGELLAEALRTPRHQTPNPI